MKKYLLFSILLICLFQNGSGQNKYNVISPRRNCFGLAEDKTDAIKIRIRCQATIIPDTPLYIIDGVISNEIEVKNIHPNNIESIRILRDAQAEAIGGCRGLNGVIIITTKCNNWLNMIVKSERDLNL